MEGAFLRFGGVPTEILFDNPKALVEHHDRTTREVRFNDRLHAFARYWSFAPKACAPFQARTKGKDERGVGYVKKNAIAERRFESWAAFEAHLDRWTREIADQHIHGTTGVAPAERFAEEAGALRPLGGKAPFGQLRDLIRKVQADCAIDLDTNSYSVPWRLIGESVQVVVLGGRVIIRHAGEVVADHAVCVGRRQRIVDRAHLIGVVGAAGPVCSEAPLPPALLRPLAEYEALVGGAKETIDHETLIAHLDRLKLTAIRDQLDTLFDEASRSKMTLREALAFLVTREIARHDERRISMASKIDQFPFVRELDGFDFEAQPSLDPGHVRELATCRWIAHGDTVLFLGPPGTGKTHLAVALGREAIRQNYSVQFVTAATLVAMLSKAHADGLLEKQLATLSRPKLLIIDEIGYLPFEANAAHLFFQLVSRRYEKGSIMITSNRSVGEWGGVFGDPVVATAILDRLLHHSSVITIRSDSYRLREKRRSGLLQKTGAALEPNPSIAE